MENINDEEVLELPLIEKILKEYRQSVQTKDAIIRRLSEALDCYYRNEYFKNNDEILKEIESLRKDAIKKWKDENSEKFNDIVEDYLFTPTVTFDENDYSFKDDFSNWVNKPFDNLIDEDIQKKLKELKSKIVPLKHSNDIINKFNQIASQYI